MTNQQDLMAQQRRLEILRILKQDPDYRMNDELIGKVLAMRGMRIAHSVIIADLAWLEQQRMISTQELPGCTVALLRNDGVDAADGVLHVPGIARPRPE